MKAYRPVYYGLVLLLLTAFRPSEACEYVGSNITFIRTQTEKALEEHDLNLARYHAYKALNAIEKSKKQLDDCGCDYAAIGVEESEYLIKKAIKLGSVEEAKILLKRALKHTEDSLVALERHHEHLSSTSETAIAMNMTDADTGSEKVMKSDRERLHSRIDSALVKYKQSLEKVVKTINCKEAKAFAEKIYLECEQELLIPGLSEGRKYYNLQTLKITAEALDRIGECQ